MNLRYRSILIVKLAFTLSYTSWSSVWSQVQASPNSFPMVYVEDMTRGLRFDPPLHTVVQSSSDPNLLFASNHAGRVYSSEDGGKSWLENTILTTRSSFLGSSYHHQLLSFEPLYFLQEGILPSPGQVFSFQNLININQRLPQAGGMVRSFFNQDVYGNPYTPGFIPPHRANRASWRLKGAVRSKKGWEIGVHWRNQIAAKSPKGKGVFYLAVHPKNKNEILAATQDGLYHSRDGGDSWPLALSGVDPRSRHMNVIRFHPNRPKEIWVGSNKGLWISKDGGQTYLAHPNPLILTSDVTWIAFNTRNPQEVYVGLGWSLLRSTDGGKNFSIVFIRPWPPLSRVTQILVDPQRPTSVLLGTQDGLMISVNSGKNFERAGGLLFVGQPIVSIVVGQRAGHYLVATKDDLWQSFDYGQSWQIAYFGQINWDIRRVVASVNEIDTFWVVTSAEILKMSFKPTTALHPDLYARIKTQLDHEPTLGQAIRAGFKRFNVERKERIQLRKNARLSALLPVIDVGFAHRQIPIEFALANYLILDNGLTNLNDSTFTHRVFGAFAWWDLHKLLFHTGELPRGRGESQTRKLEYKVRTVITNLYQERRSLLESMIAFPLFGRSKLMQELRLEELTAHLNQLTHNLFRPFSVFDQGILSW